MDITIRISDASGSTDPQLSVSGSVAEAAPHAAAPPGPGAAATHGAINGGPAPAALAARGGNNAPQPFVGDAAHAAAQQPTDQSAGAAPAL